MNMKKIFGIIVLAMLAVCSTALVSCGDDEENITPQEQENNDDKTDKPDDPENQDTPEVKDIIVEVDEEGKANDGHRFTKIDATNFYIDDIKYTASQGNLIVSGYDQAYFSGEANIITTLKYDGRTMNVTEIRANVFKYCTVLTSITIPNSVTKIGEYAFAYCSGLTSIAIPTSVTSIGGYAFAACSGLTSINIPNSVTSIGSYAFEDCSNLSSIVVDCSTLGSWFRGLTSIREVTIGSNVTSIGPQLK